MDKKTKQNKVVIVTGSRNWKDKDTVWKALDKENPTLVVHGGAKGADAIADEWASKNDVECRVYKAKWNTYGLAAGPIRNEFMVTEYPDAEVLAFPTPDSKGAVHCMNFAMSRGLAVKNYGHTLEECNDCSVLMNRKYYCGDTDYGHEGLCCDCFDESLGMPETLRTYNRKTQK